VTRDFGQAARYARLVIALRTPVCFSLGIVTAATAGLAAALPTPPVPGGPELPTATPEEPLEMRWQSHAPACDRDAITAIVIRGQFTSRERSHEGFAISFAGSSGRYTAITDARGYFEVHVPREDFEGDPCDLSLTYREFHDEQMTLRYRIDLDR
jgi:hypothetical protein